MVGKLGTLLAWVAVISGALTALSGLWGGRPVKTARGALLATTALVAGPDPWGMRPRVRLSERGYSRAVAGVAGYLLVSRLVRASSRARRTDGEWQQGPNWGDAIPPAVRLARGGPHTASGGLYASFR